MRYLLGLAILASGCWPSFAQDSARNRCNQKARTQMEMNACAADEAGRADAELNLVYKKLLTLVQDDAVAANKIRVQERAWVSYRDAYLDAMYPAEDKQTEYGSMYPMEVEDLRTQLTRKHLQALNDLVRQFSSGR